MWYIYQYNKFGKCTEDWKTIKRIRRNNNNREEPTHISFYEHVIQKSRQIFNNSFQLFMNT